MSPAPHKVFKPTGKMTYKIQKKLQKWNRKKITKKIIKLTNKIMKKIYFKVTDVIIRVLCVPILLTVFAVNILTRATIVLLTFLHMTLFMFNGSTWRDIIDAVLVMSRWPGEKWNSFKK